MSGLALLDLCRLFEGPLRSKTCLSGSLLIMRSPVHPSLVVFGPCLHSRRVLIFVSSQCTVASLCCSVFGLRTHGAHSEPDYVSLMSSFIARGYAAHFLNGGVWHFNSRLDPPSYD